ncbi:MAG: hypothetical protein CMK36_03080 [Porticoccaceae bacterium]|nr:hypothetical protein [Porticoccaceae bacterium]|tara:strand:- start:41 stop:334 length:294 start_codon:yes stop_codon:yes gene_type:complete
MDGDDSNMHAESYWKANVWLLIKLLTIWGFVSFGCSIILVDWLDQFSFFGFKLGFWFSQQGAILVFICLIFFYAKQMNTLDKKFTSSESKRNGEKRS